MNVRRPGDMAHPDRRMFECVGRCTMRDEIRDVRFESRDFYRVSFHHNYRVYAASEWSILPPEAPDAKAQCESGLLIFIPPSRPCQCLDTP